MAPVLSLPRDTQLCPVVFDLLSPAAAAGRCRGGRGNQF